MPRGRLFEEAEERAGREPAGERFGRGPDAVRREVSEMSGISHRGKHTREEKAVATGRRDAFEASSS